MADDTAGGGSRRPVTRFGLQIPSFSYPGVPDDQLFERIAELAGTAERGGGFDSLWVMDHFYQLPMLGAPEEPMLEAYTLLSGLAARTSRLRLGAMVTGVTYRNPALLAKTVTTLDIVSAGRAILGIGAAWFEQEHNGYGFDFPPARERLDRLEEALQIARGMFTQPRFTFHGRYYRTEEALNSPRPVRPGGIPVLVGGSGEKRTLRLVAQYADACNLFGDPDVIRHKLSVLRAHCETEGRDEAEITKTALSTLLPTGSDAETRQALEAVAERTGAKPEEIADRMIVGTEQQITERIGEYLDAGLDGIVFNLAVPGPEAVERAGRLLAGIGG